MDVVRVEAYPSSSSDKFSNEFKVIPELTKSAVVVVSNSVHCTAAAEEETRRPIHEILNEERQ